MTDIGIVVSRFNGAMTKALYEGVRARLAECEIPDNTIHTVWVPGAVEIPLLAQQFARRENIAAVICLGVVVRGETGHYEYVCQQVSNGCQRVALDFDKPMIFGVLTTENEEQAWDRIRGSQGHKGREVADAALEMILLMREFQIKK